MKIVVFFFVHSITEKDKIYLLFETTVVYFSIMWLTIHKESLSTSFPLWLSNALFTETVLNSSLQSLWKYEDNVSFCSSSVSKGRLGIHFLAATQPKTLGNKWCYCVECPFQPTVVLWQDSCLCQAKFGPQSLCSPTTIKSQGKER